MELVVKKGLEKLLMDRTEFAEDDEGQCKRLRGEVFEAGAALLAGEGLDNLGEYHQAMARALGRRVSYQPVSTYMFLKAALAQGFPTFQVAHFRHYAEEARKGAYAIGAPTGHVLEVTGRHPEDFDTIARRYAKHPEAKRTVANTGSALALMMKMLTTRVPDLDRWELDRDHPLIANGMLAQDNPDWLKTAERQQPNVLYTKSKRTHGFQGVARQAVFYT